MTLTWGLAFPDFLRLTFENATLTISANSLCVNNALSLSFFIPSGKLIGIPLIYYFNGLILVKLNLIVLLYYVKILLFQDNLSFYNFVDIYIL